MNFTENELLRWATERVAGCDGGNIKTAKIWTCGIEWGWAKSNQEERELYYSQGLIKEITGQEKLINDHLIYDAERLSSRYDRQFLKLLSVIKGFELSQYLNNVVSKDEVFKLNLFPIAFQKDYDKLWIEYHLHKTFEQFPDKESYRNWCREYRFRYFKELTQIHRPDIILCFGLGYAQDFCNAFGGKELVEYKDALVDISPRNSRPRTFYYSQTSSGSDLYVLPFLVNRNGLNSGYLLNAAGSHIYINRLGAKKDCLKKIKKS